MTTKHETMRSLWIFLSRFRLKLFCGIVLALCLTALGLDFTRTEQLEQEVLNNYRLQRLLASSNLNYRDSLGSANTGFQTNHKEIFHEESKQSKSHSVFRILEDTHVANLIEIKSDPYASKKASALSDSSYNVYNAEKRPSDANVPQDSNDTRPAWIRAVKTGRKRANPRERTGADIAHLTANHSESLTRSSKTDMKKAGENIALQEQIMVLSGSVNDKDRDIRERKTDFVKNENNVKSLYVQDGIYWSDLVENSIPKGISELTADSWIRKTRRLRFKSLQPPTWNRCGRPKNGFATLQDGTGMCARYRSPNDRLVLGEVMSYWLSRLMALDNVPPVTLSRVNSSQWSAQMESVRALGWREEGIVALIMWIHEIDTSSKSKVFMPEPVLRAYKMGQPVGAHTLEPNPDNSNVNESRNSLPPPASGRYTLRTVVETAQFGSMILLDYLTGNYDRVASMQDGAEQEKKPAVVEEAIRNLRQSYPQDKLWLIDNESGLLDAYDLLYTSPNNGQRFVHFHDQMLRTLCVFQKPVVGRLLALHQRTAPHRYLEEVSIRHDPLVSELDKDSSYILFVRKFKERLNKVVEWIRYCEQIS